KPPGFEEWLEEIYDQKFPFYYSMVRYLKTLGFIDGSNPDSILEGLQKFYFIGITERYEEDAFYLFHELGVKRFPSDRNASTPYVSRNQLGRSVIERIGELNREDVVLYEMALKENARFRRTTDYFDMSVNKLRIRKEKQHSIFSKITRLLP